MLGARSLHLLCVSESPDRVKLTVKHSEASTLGDRGVLDNNGLHRKKCACVWVFACSLFSTLINNVTAHVATWPVSSQQPASSCQELFNPHTNKTLPGRDFTAPLIKLLFWDGNLAQSLLICLAFSVPIRDSSPWQTNKPLLGV